MDGIRNLASTVSSRFTNNVTASFSALTLQQWIRLVAIVGAYLLLRPYILKLGARFQMKQLEKEGEESEREAARLAALTPNELRGQNKKLVLPDESDSEGDEAEGAGAGSSATDWGKKARRRQRHMVKKMLEAHEKKLAEEQADEEDKDIQEFLVD
ncbi:uncharacterized protein E0L32_008672 [Thyridium curvatum]|uniref:Uncharacterized protein n=1 Tax=Thyridium curvatum TaxID=1093900 RepID=A0A507ARL6_9PEZI|nr:uncharacterized protein E0L32_008672 [Thyridium curvatum]TPX10453.1 hypothetical protein E0L32_008672 [Thyridium curvatum]